MNFHYRYFFILFIFLIAACSSEKKDLSTLVDKHVNLAVTQYKGMITQVPDERFPIFFEDDSLVAHGSRSWCSGFYPGTLLYLYEKTGDSTLLNEAERTLEILEKEQYNTNTHDLGFMMFCSFGNAKKIEPKPEYDEIIIKSAKSLASRYSPEVKSIRSWNSRPEDFLVIIDNMMNLEMLFQATKMSGDSSFHDIAITHANTTIENHFRNDNSSYHVLNYDPETGEIKEKRTEQGLHDESVWARGQAWGLYGFTMTYRETGIEKYLDQAEKIADFLLSHPNLPEDKVPIWDFSDEEREQRDVSAGAIMASALFELHEYLPKKNYQDIAIEIVKTIARDYTNEAGENGNFITDESVGHLPKDAEVGVPLIYADYYFIEALLRMEKIVN
ncbi:MAG: glycoside hydrolase family 88 protein [Balneolaceae bacterium]